MGTKLPPSQKGHSPQFSAHIRCCQKAGWIKIQLGMEVDLGPGDTRQLPPPNFRPVSVVVKRPDE